MKVSRTWLQKYFEKTLPNAEGLSEALTFHAFELEEAAGDLLDIKVLPNRSADCLSHRGIAKELSAILNIPLSSDPLREPADMNDLVGRSCPLEVTIEDPKKCFRYVGAFVRGVKVGPSPDWLKTALESAGQRSINNVVDATNYVMLDIGQPLHAFDAGKLKMENGKWKIEVRNAKAGEKITTLSDDDHELSKEILLIADANADTAIGIAGIKGGKVAQVNETTTDLIIESANFDGTTIRRGAQALKLFTDASLRFQNRPSPELVAYGISDVLELIKKVAGGEVVGVVDTYPAPAAKRPAVSATLTQMNGLLGSDFSHDEVASIFKRLDLDTKVDGEIFTITPPFERNDLMIPEDLIEEVGRIAGYNRVSAALLPATDMTPDQARYCGIERMKDQLVEQGFVEVSTQSFAAKGDITLANPLDKAKPALRTSLEANLADALTRAKLSAPLVLSPNQKPKLFEVGTVFPKEGEHLELRMTETAWDGVPTHDNLTVAKLEDYGKDYEPKRYELGAYKPFSAYPFIARDVAYWGDDAESVIRESAGPLLIRLDQFDRFEKDERTSYAYRLVFQSFERTLTDEEVNGIMEKVYVALRTKGYEIR